MSHGPVAAAGELGISYQLLQYWVKNGVPPKHVVRVSGHTGISPEKIRPDIFCVSNHSNSKG